VAVAVGVGRGDSVTLGRGVKVGSGGISDATRGITVPSDSGATVASWWTYATVGTRLSALMPLAFANPAALSMSDSPATGVP